MALRWGLKPRQLLEAAQKHPVFDARENLSQRKTPLVALEYFRGIQIETMSSQSSATSSNVGRACVGEGFPGASKTWMFLRRLHGRIHAGPGKPSPRQAHTLTERDSPTLEFFDSTVPLAASDYFISALIFFASSASTAGSANSRACPFISWPI